MSDRRTKARRLLVRLWAVLGNVSLAQWLISLGVGGGVSTTLRLATSLPLPLYTGIGSSAFLATGVFLHRSERRQVPVGSAQRSQAGSASALRVDLLRQELQDIKRVTVEEMRGFDLPRPGIQAGGSIQAGGDVTAPGDIRAGAGTTTERQPWLAGGADSTVTVQVQGDVVTGSLRLQNVGDGLAIIDDQQSHIFGWDQDRRMRQFANLRVATPVVAVNAHADVGFVMDTRRWPPLDTSTFLSPDSVDPNLAFDLRYTDRAGTHHQFVRFLVTQVAGQPGRWELYRIEYRTEADSEPFQRINVRNLPQLGQPAV